MSNEKLARQWAEYYKDNFPRYPEGSRDAEIIKKAKAAAEYILEHTDPPTMADVEWDDEKYFLAGATDSDGDPCVMVKDRLGDEIWIIDPSLQHMYRLPTYKLTPNGKRYELREKPDHPEVLKTVEDYQNAPEGTLAASMHGEGYFHNETMSRWESTHGDWKNYTEMESSSPSGRMVLRWGWGGEA